MAPPKPTIDLGRPLANVVISPVSGSTREILPAAPSLTYSALSGPTVLPEPPSRPVSSWVRLGPPAGDAAAAVSDVTLGLAAAVAVGATMAIATVASATRCLAIMAFSLLVLGVEVGVRHA